LVEHCRSLSSLKNTNVSARVLARGLESSLRNAEKHEEGCDSLQAATEVFRQTVATRYAHATPASNEHILNTLRHAPDLDASTKQQLMALVGNSPSDMDFLRHLDVSALRGCVGAMLQFAEKRQADGGFCPMLGRMASSIVHHCALPGGSKPAATLEASIKDYLRDQLSAQARMSSAPTRRSRRSHVGGAGFFTVAKRIGCGVLAVAAGLVAVATLSVICVPMAFGLRLGWLGSLVEPLLPLSLASAFIAGEYALTGKTDWVDKEHGWRHIRNEVMYEGPGGYTARIQDKYTTHPVDPFGFKQAMRRSGN
jgi:hypothetical protein